MTIRQQLSFILWYFRHPPWDSGITPPELLSFLKHVPPGRAIDLGCGTGTNVITLTRMGWQVVGLDFAPNAIRLARKRIRKAGINTDLRVGDVTKLDGISGPFDLALDLGCFHGLSDKERAAFLKKLDQILAPGGYWFLYAHQRPVGEKNSVGISSEDIIKLQSFFTLIQRMDGLDHGKRPSFYLIFKKLTGKENT